MFMYMTDFVKSVQKSKIFISSQFNHNKFSTKDKQSALGSCQYHNVWAGFVSYILEYTILKKVVGKRK